jgi:hypothetical protein
MTYLLRTPFNTQYLTIKKVTKYEFPLEWKLPDTRLPSSFRRKGKRFAGLENAEVRYLVSLPGIAITVIHGLFCTKCFTNHSIRGSSNSIHAGTMTSGRRENPFQWLLLMLESGSCLVGMGGGFYCLVTFVTWSIAKFWGPMPLTLPSTIYESN